MGTEQMLSVLAIMRAYLTADAEGLEVLIKDAPASGYADLLAFATLMINNGSDNPVAYIDKLAREVYTMHVHELARQN